MRTTTAISFSLLAISAASPLVLAAPVARSSVEKRGVPAELVAAGKDAFAWVTGKTAQRLAAKAADVETKEGKVALRVLGSVWKNQAKVEPGAVDVITGLRTAALKDLQDNGAKMTRKNAKLLQTLAYKGGDKAVKAEIEALPLATRLKFGILTPTQKHVGEAVVIGGAAVGAGVAIKEHQKSKEESESTTSEDGDASESAATEASDDSAAEVQADAESQAPAEKRSLNALD